MFSIFNKRSKFILPPFEALGKYPNKGKYFYRITSWYWLDKDQIVIVDPHNPRLITLDPWPQLVFLNATGKMTIMQYVEYMATQYKSAPEQLDETIIYQVDQLLKERLIALSAMPQELDPRHNDPIDFK
jgi:hypothetical protein